MKTRCTAAKFLLHRISDCGHSHSLQHILSREFTVPGTNRAFAAAAPMIALRPSRSLYKDLLGETSKFVALARWSSATRTELMKRY
jgi:hypothetical protein